jgi:hypothetical protein
MCIIILQKVSLIRFETRTLMFGVLQGVTSLEPDATR